MTAWACTGMAQIDSAHQPAVIERRRIEVTAITLRGKMPRMVAAVCVAVMANEWQKYEALSAFRPCRFHALRRWRSR